MQSSLCRRYQCVAGYTGPEFLRLGPGSPALLGLQERVWGATTILPVSALPPGVLLSGIVYQTIAVSKLKKEELVYMVRDAAGDKPERIAVVRDAFTGSHDLPQPLSSSLAVLGNGSVAIASHLSQYHRRLIVDEYELSGDGTYVLRHVATDLFRCLLFSTLDAS